MQLRELARLNGTLREDDNRSVVMLRRLHRNLNILRWKGGWSLQVFELISLLQQDLKALAELRDTQHYQYYRVYQVWRGWPYCL